VGGTVVCCTVVGWTRILAGVVLATSISAELTAGADTDVVTWENPAIGNLDTEGTLDMVVTVVGTGGTGKSKVVLVVCFL